MSEEDSKLICFFMLKEAVRDLERVSKFRKHRSQTGIQRAKKNARGKIVFLARELFSDDGHESVENTIIPQSEITSLKHSRNNLLGIVAEVSRLVKRDQNKETIVAAVKRAIGAKD